MLYVIHLMRNGIHILKYARNIRYDSTEVLLPETV